MSDTMFPMSAPPSNPTDVEPFDTISPPRWGCGDIALGLGVSILCFIAFAAPVAALGASDGVIGLVATIAQQVGMAGWLIYVSRRKGAGSLREDFGFSFKPIDPVIGVAFGFVIMIAASGIITALSALFNVEVVGNAESIFASQETKAGLLLMAAIAMFGAPIVEELFFRGLAFRSLERRFGRAAGVAGSAVLFGFLHWPSVLSVTQAMILVATLTFLGASFALLASHYRRLGPSIVAHLTLNSVSVAAVLAKELGAF